MFYTDTSGMNCFRKNMMRIGVVAISILSLLSACAATSNGGVVLGVKGSPAWNKFAPEKDIAAYYDSKRTVELCLTWDKAINESLVRTHIIDALERRGEPGDKCYNPEADALVRSKPETVYVPSPAPTPDPVYAPQIQMPQTTYCHINHRGTAMSCN